jgi:hypothetical protein
MTVIETIETDESAAEAVSAARSRATFYFVVASLLLGGGFLAPLLGLIFFLVHSFVAHDHLLSAIGSVLLVVSIPMLLAGSHFLDVVDEKKRASS